MQCDAFVQFAARALRTFFIAATRDSVCCCSLGLLARRQSTCICGSVRAEPDGLNW